MKPIQKKILVGIAVVIAVLYWLGGRHVDTEPVYSGGKPPPPQVNYNTPDLTLSQVETECALRYKMAVAAVQYRLSKNNLVTNDEVSEKIFQSTVSAFDNPDAPNMSNIKLWANLFSNLASSVSLEKMQELVAGGYGAETEKCISETVKLDQMSTRPNKVEGRYSYPTALINWDKAGNVTFK